MTSNNGNGLTNKELLQIILDQVEELNNKLSDMNEKKVSRYELYSILGALTTVSFLVVTVVM